MSEEEHFSISWNNFNSNLTAGFYESLCRGDLVDVTLVAEGHFLKAHRLVLSVCSPHFRKMFLQMPTNQHAFVFLNDTSHTALRDLLQFMYCGEVNVERDAIPEFISTAEALQVKGVVAGAAPSTSSATAENVKQKRNSTNRSYKIGANSKRSSKSDSTTTSSTIAKRSKEEESLMSLETVKTTKSPQSSSSQVPPPEFSTTLPTDYLQVETTEPDKKYEESDCNGEMINENRNESTLKPESFVDSKIGILKLSKRGRPKKPGRPRGRPVKSILHIKNGTTLVVGRRRGRPRKPIDVNQIAVKRTPKRRGRPPSSSLNSSYVTVKQEPILNEVEWDQQRAIDDFINKGTEE